MCIDVNEGTLVTNTRRLLQGTDASYLDIYNATKLSPSWLSLFAQGKVRDPSVNKVQKLYEHLSGRPLLSN